MCEFLAVVFLGRAVIGRMAEHKGYWGGFFTFLFVLVWFAAETGAFLYGAGVLGPGPLPDRSAIYGAYFKALGAAVGASVLLLVVVMLLPDIRYSGRPVRSDNPEEDDEDDRPPPPRRPRRRDDDDFD